MQVFTAGAGGAVVAAGAVWTGVAVVGADVPAAVVAGGVLEHAAVSNSKVAATAMRMPGLSRHVLICVTRVT
ncbi:hypothetical protein [Lentzea sp.]|uniref:hypothetical protein n=1 Tax=Lentzea sp. TaxID=56099 RepID=UPI002C5AAE3F|nr:hypothetical protein [Lentzea sp.]HUQ61509.1 hypothetical protein [Lentzea sp.]